MIGDHKQLEATVFSPENDHTRYSRSMFERLIDGEKFSAHMLDTQYRMHPKISAFSSV
jgi:senataxin